MNAQIGTYVLFLPEELVSGLFGFVDALTHGELCGVLLRLEVGFRLRNRVLNALAQSLRRVHFSIGSIFVVLAKCEPLLWVHGAFKDPT